MNRTTTMLAVLLLILGAAIPGAVSATDQCTINEFGGPRRFADQGARTLSALQGVFEVHRHDIEKLLGEVGWQGEPKDLFKAVAAGDVEVAVDRRRVPLDQGGERLIRPVMTLAVLAMAGRMLRLY